MKDERWPKEIQSKTHNKINKWTNFKLWIKGGQNGRMLSIVAVF